MSHNIDSNTISIITADPRPLIRVRGLGFEGSKYCVPTITQSFKAHFVGPWPTFSDVPNEVKDLWFQTFSRSFRWAEEDTPLVRKTWEKVCRTRLSGQLFRDRQRFKESSPAWIDSEIWTQLLSHWNTEDFKSKSAAAKRNRKAGPTHTGGSVSFSKHESRAQKEHGPSVEYSDIFRRLHVFQSGPKKGEFNNERSKNAMEEFTRLKEHYSRISPSSGSIGSSYIPNDKELFVEASGGFNKGRAYGSGSESSVIKAQLNPVTSPDARVTELQKQVHVLKENMKEYKTQYHDLQEKYKEKYQKYVEICNYLKQIAEHVGTSSLHVGSSSVPPVPSSLIEDDNDTLADTPS